MLGGGQREGRLEEDVRLQRACCKVEPGAFMRGRLGRIENLDLERRRNAERRSHRIGIRRATGFQLLVSRGVVLEGTALSEVKRALESDAI